MTDARLTMIRHWHLRNGHPPSDGQDYCEGCAYEMDDLIKHMDAAGLVIVPKVPTDALVEKLKAACSDDGYDMMSSNVYDIWRAMVEASHGE
jgi:hypothetical protein